VKGFVAWKRVLVPWLNAGVNLLLDTGVSAVWDQSRALILLNYGALSFAIVITLWGSERIALRLEALRPATSEIFAIDSAARFRGMNSVVGPIVASAATAVAFAIGAFVDGGWAAAILRGATWRHPWWCAALFHSARSSSANPRASTHLMPRRSRTTSTTSPQLRQRATVPGASR
jgi:hypothetical protein